MPQPFPSRQELESMSLTHLRNQNITNKEQEDLVQEIVNLRIKELPVQQKVYRGDVPMEIKDKATEEKWQAIIDERELAIRNLGRSEEVVLEAKVESLEAKKVELEKELEIVKPDNVFCQYCDSKGIRHKKNCTRVI